jgi:hypothetical protein
MIHVSLLEAKVVILPELLHALLVLFCCSRSWLLGLSLQEDLWVVAIVCMAPRRVLRVQLELSVHNVDPHNEVPMKATLFCA